MGTQRLITMKLLLISLVIAIGRSAPVLEELPNDASKDAIVEESEFQPGSLNSGFLQLGGGLHVGSTVALKGGQGDKYCADEGDNIACNRDMLSQWEKFTVVNAGGGKIALKGGKKSKYCADEGNNIACDRDELGQWEGFTVVNAGCGKIALKGGKKSKYCADEQQFLGDKVVCDRDKLGQWEKFTVECLSDCDPEKKKAEEEAAAKRENEEADKKKKREESAQKCEQAAREAVEQL